MTMVNPGSKGLKFIVDVSFPPQAANCTRNFQLVVDEDQLM